MAVSVTNTDMTSFNAITALTANPATDLVANHAEVFTITPTRRDGRVIIIIDNVASDQGTVTYSIAAGGYWGADAALTGAVAQGVKSAIVLEGYKYKSASATIVITFTPATDKILLTNHALSVYVLELPFNSTI